MLYLKNDDKTIESYYILFKDKDLNKKFKLSSYKYNDSLKVSGKVLEACCSGYNIQKKNIVNLSFFKENNIDEKNIQQILNCNLSSNIKNYILEELENLKDFMFFTELLKDKIVLEKYYEYQISELLKIRDLCDKNKVNSEASSILNITQYAEDNAKVLKLSNNINKLKC